MRWLKKLKWCKVCGRYTLQPVCGRCGGPTHTPHPPRFSPQDKFGKYRRMLKLARPANP